MKDMDIDYGHDIPYFFDNAKYTVRIENTKVGIGSYDPTLANMLWLTFPIYDVLAESKPNALELLYKGGAFVNEELARDDYADYQETLEGFMINGPIAFVNRMKGWDGSRAFALYKKLGDKWFDTMLQRAYQASAYLGHESNPIKPPKTKPPVKAEGNVISVDFGGKKR